MKPTTKDYLYAIGALLLMALAQSLDYYWTFGG